MKRHPINILKKISMILFDNKTKIKWEWNNIIKRKIKNKTEIQSLTKQTAKDDLKEKLKKTKKTNSSQQIKHATNLWGQDNSKQKTK